MQLKRNETSRQGLRPAGHRRHGQGTRRSRGGRCRQRQCIDRRRRGQRAQRQVAVDYTLIRAPFDGVILSKSANVGDLVTPFSSAAESKGAVVTMADMSTLEVEADVSESSLAKSRSVNLRISLDALPDVRFRGHINRWCHGRSRQGDGDDQGSFDAIDPRVLPEMSAKVSFLSQDVTPNNSAADGGASDALLARRATDAVRDSRWQGQ
jgi:multidrug efflux pump subunit AcrA (membrane-fusion protein)